MSLTHYEDWVTLKAPGLLKHAASKKQNRSKRSKSGFGHFSQQSLKAHSRGIKQQSFLGDS